MRDLAERKSRARRRLGKRATRRCGRRSRTSDRSPRPHVRAVKRARSRPAETGHRRQAPLRQPGRQPRSGGLLCCFRGPMGHGAKGTALAPRWLSAARDSSGCQTSHLGRFAANLSAVEHQWRRAAVYVTVEDTPLAEGGNHGEGSNEKQQRSQDAKSDKPKTGFG